MAEHHISLEYEGPTKRPNKGATGLRQILIRRANGEKTLVDIDVNTCKATCPYADIFKIYLGLLA